MRRTVALILGGVVFLGAACGGDEHDSADSSAASTTAPRGEPIVIRTRMVIAAVEGAEPIATGEVVEGSTLGSSAFCVGGTILDSHASPDPEVMLIARTITCPDGSVRLNLAPKVTPGLTQTGTWRIVGGTGAFEEFSGSGAMEGVSDPDVDSLARETLTGSVRPHTP